MGFLSTLKDVIVDVVWLYVNVNPNWALRRDYLSENETGQSMFHSVLITIFTDITLRKITHDII